MSEIEQPVESGESTAPGAHRPQEYIADVSFAALNLSEPLLREALITVFAHLEENVAAVNIQLSDEEFAALDRAGRKERAS